MALRNILEFPDPRLRIPAEPVLTSDETLQTLIDDMFETMYHAHGVGLAATQVGVNKRVAVIDVSEAKNQPLCIINPTLISSSEPTKMTEGCLSIPQVFDTVTRANKVKITAFDRNIQKFELEAEGLLAECIQHEIDHLSGKLYIDYLSTLKRQRIRQKIKKSAAS